MSILAFIRLTSLQQFQKMQQLFDANRNREILENTKLGEWNHISGAQHLADLGTRGMIANEYARSVWLNMSAWLSDNEAHWSNLLLRTLLSRTH